MLERADRALLATNRFVVGTLVLVMTVLVFSNVVLRYAFGVSLSWVEELTRYMMIWVAYLGAGLALRAGAHVAVDIFQEALPEAGVRILRTVIVLITLAFLAAVVWYGVAYAQFTMRQRSPVLGIPLGYVYLGVPIGAGLMALHLLLALPRFVQRRFEVPEPAAEADAEILSLADNQGQRV